MTERNDRERTQFLITIDTETYAVNGIPPHFDANIYGSVPGDALGVPKIMEICDKYNVKGTFFVDVYMYHYYGRERVRDLCRFIDKHGHDVQLHAHTSWLPNSTSGSLSSFSLQRQVEIIAEGRDLIEDWVGMPPVAFRAGAYTANLDTIQAMEQNGFVVDSSYFAFHRNCGLSQQLGNRYTNKVFQIGHVFEIPVTTYWLLRLPSWRKISKIDINSCSLSEMCDVIAKLIDARVRYIVLFLHSFSFIKWKSNYSGFNPNYRAVRRFEALLQQISTWGYQGSFCTMKQAALQIGREKEEAEDFIPTLSLRFIFSRAFQRIVE